MTEDQAKGRWCPFARAAMVWKKGRRDEVEVAVTMNRGATVAGDCTCLAAGCMAWQKVADAGPFSINRYNADAQLKNPNVVSMTAEEIAVAGLPPVVSDATWLRRIAAEGMCGLCEPKVVEVYHE